jgi:hypothetical protein
MYSLLYFAILALQGFLVAGVIEDNYHSPFGVNFSSSAICTSRYNASGLVHTTKNPTSPEYITYYNAALDIYSQGNKRDPMTYYHFLA